MTPSSAFRTETEVSVGDQAGAFVSDNGERTWNVGRLRVQVARFEIAAPHLVRMRSRCLRQVLFAVLGNNTVAIAQLPESLHNSSLGDLVGELPALRRNTSSSGDATAL